MSAEVFKVGDKVMFCRDRDGVAEPYTVTRVSGQIVTIACDRLPRLRVSLGTCHSGLTRMETTQ